MSAIAFEKVHENLHALFHPRRSRESSEEFGSKNEKLPEKSHATEEPVKCGVGGEEEQSSNDEELSHNNSGSNLTHSSIEEKRDIFIHFEVLRAGQHKASPFLHNRLSNAADLDSNMAFDRLDHICSEATLHHMPYI